MFEKEYLESFGTKIKARINIKKEEPIFSFVFFFQAEDGIRDLVRSRGLGDVYKRQLLYT